MREKIKTAAEALDEALDKVEDIVEDTSKAAKKAATKAATKAKRQVKAAAEMAEPVAEEVKKAVRAPRKKATTDVYVQWDEAELDMNEIVEKAKAAFKQENKGAIQTCRVYIKPQEKMAYYVINDIAGKVEL